MLPRPKKSIEPSIDTPYKELIPSLTSSFIIGFLLVFFAYFRKNYLNKDSKEIIITLQEMVSLNSIFFWFLFCLLMWGLYFIILGCKPEIYDQFKRVENWIIRFTVEFVRFSLTTAGVLFSVKISLSLLKIFSKFQIINFDPIKEVSDLGDNIHREIIIFSCFFVLLLSDWILYPITKSNNHKTVGASHRNPLFKKKNRLKLIISGGFIVILSFSGLIWALVG